MRLFLALMLLLSPALLRAANAVSLSSTVFVERLVKDTDGRRKLVLEPPKTVIPGDRLVYILQYRNAGSSPAANVYVVNPIPTAVIFQGAADPSAQVSVDGGQNWGRVETLKKRESDGMWRGARLEDVTHVRWIIARPIKAGATGKLSFRGLVR
jgi:uncharacterized repeat protein (TIGR01451 family)